MSVKVRNDGHFEHEGCVQGEIFLSILDFLVECFKRQTKSLTDFSNIKEESCWECGCSFHAVQLISNRSQSVSVITAAQMALQSAPCKEWIIIITHNLLFNTCLLLHFLKLYTTVIHKSSSSFFRSASDTVIVTYLAVWKNPVILIVQPHCDCQSHLVFAYSDTHSLLLFGEVGIVDTSLQLFPVSLEKPPTPLECLVCALWSLILIIKLSLQHEPWAANSGALGSSALNQSNQVLHWRTFSLFSIRSFWFSLISFS